MNQNEKMGGMILTHNGWRIEMTGKQTIWSIETITDSNGKLVDRIEYGIEMDYQTRLKFELEESRDAFAEVQRLLSDIETHRIDDPKLLGLIEATSCALNEWQKLFEAIELLREGFFDLPRGNATEWAFDTFKQKAVSAGGVVSDELLAEFKEDLSAAIQGENDDIELFGGQV